MDRRKHLTNLVKHAEDNGLYDRTTDDMSPQYAWIDPCETGHYCGNGAMTVRHVDGVGPVKMCESCAAEHDEGGE